MRLAIWPEVEGMLEHVARRCPNLKIDSKKYFPQTALVFVDISKDGIMAIMKKETHHEWWMGSFGVKPTYEEIDTILRFLKEHADQKWGKKPLHGDFSTRIPLAQEFGISIIEELVCAYNGIFGPGTMVILPEPLEEPDGHYRWTALSH